MSGAEAVYFVYLLANSVIPVAVLSFEILCDVMKILNYVRH